MDEKIGGAWILMSECEVMSKLMMSSLGSYACRETRHKTSSTPIVTALTEHDITRPKLM